MYRRLTALLAMMMLAAMMAAAPAQAGDWQTTKFPITQAQVNACNGDIVVINGTLTTRTRITNGSDGFIRFEVRDRISGTGVSNTGAKYKYSSDARSDDRVKQQRYLYTHLTQRIRLEPVDTSGKSMNVNAVVEMVTDTQTGETTLIKDEYKAECL